MNTYHIITIALLAMIGTQTSYLTFSRTRGVRKKAGVAIIVDTSVLIDGRIISIAESGFVTGTLVVPRSVVGELQYMADNADHDKRVRARYGLDVIQHLQNMKDVDVQILQDNRNRKKFDVDTQLVELAKQHKAHLCTVDYNLNKVAQVEGVIVLNVNELAQALRAMHLPGERRMLALTQKGSDGHQAVGHLEDGTMVVVEHSNKFIGQTVFVEFTRVLQTQAGKMMFAKRVEEIEKGVQQKQAPTEKKPAEAAKKPKRPSPQAQGRRKLSKEAEVKEQPIQQTKRQAEPAMAQKDSTAETGQRGNRKKIQPRQRRRKTNEDSLIELANRSDT